MLSQYTQGRDNNFNLLRLIAATMVIYGHSFPFVQGFSGSREPNWSGDLLFDLTGMDSGRIAVMVFFVMSGFLVAQSLERRSSLAEFFSARLLRIMPALIAAVLFCVFVVGVTLTTQPLEEYLLSDQVRSFLVFNLTLRSDPGQLLPGVFESNPYARVVNGSLWTLPWEAMMYMTLGLLTFFGLLRRRLFMAVLLAAVYVLFCVNRETRFITLPYLPLAVAFATYFYAGVLVWLYRDRLPMGSRTLAVSLALLALSLVFYKASPIARAAYPAVLAYSIIGLALVPGGRVRAFNRLGDYSYGVYVYAFPVQQALMTAFPQLVPLQLFSLGLGFTLVLAVPSWHFIEKPMLRFKRARSEPPRRIVATEVLPITQLAR